MNTFSIGDLLVVATFFTVTAFVYELGRAWIRQSEWRRHAKRVSRDEG